jgi:hypothetical protein
MLYCNANAMRKSLKIRDDAKYKFANLRELTKVRKSGNSVKSYKPAGAALCAAAIMMRQPPGDSVAPCREKL